MNDTIILVNQCRGFIDPKHEMDNILEQYSPPQKKHEKLKTIFIFVFKVLKKLKLVKKIPYFDFLDYAEWTKLVKKYNNWVIFYEFEMHNQMAKFIKHRNKKAKVFFYSWDIKYRIKDTSYCDGAYTFEEVHAKEDNIGFLPLFYNDKYLPKRDNNCFKYYFSFVGLDKGRQKIFDEMKNECDKIGNGFWRIVKDDYSNGVAYNELLKIQSETMCLVEINCIEQTALTLRAYEALFLEKKFLTNNQHIKNYSFYQPENIFIWGVDTDLQNWIKIPYKKVSDEIREEYTFETWLKKITSTEKSKV